MSAHRPWRTFHPWEGPGVAASAAARLRTRGDYKSAARVEENFGERRIHCACGATWHVVLPARDWFADQTRK